MPAEVDESAIIGYIKSYSDTTSKKDAETNISERTSEIAAGGVSVLYEVAKGV